MTTKKSCYVLEASTVLCTLPRSATIGIRRLVGSFRPKVVTLRFESKPEKKIFGVIVRTNVILVASINAITIFAWPLPSPRTLGPSRTLPKVKTVNNGTANLVTIRTEDIVWNPPHTGTQLTKKLASFTKPPFYERRTEKTAVFNSVYPSGFPITKYFKTNRNIINVLIHIGLVAYGRLLKQGANREQRPLHTGPVPVTVALPRDKAAE